MAKTLEEIFDSFTSAMELLRNPQFQDLLENYERAKKTFLVGYEIKDDVHSEMLFEAGGKYGLEPDDYLVAFAEFVREKQNEIEAISILLNRPGNWNTRALTELKKALKDNHFEEDDLNKAHMIVYHKDLVDIISMVKHAARLTEPLMSPAERVEQAMLLIKSRRHFTHEQEQWIGYISEHLKQNMTLGEDDLKELPIFADRGGLSKFRRVFPGTYQELIVEINTTIAA